MTIKEIYEAADKIGLLSFSTIHNGEVHSRIAHFNGYDDEGIYLRTMGSKPYGRQLHKGGTVTVCGHYGEGILNHQDVGAVPHFAPGYTFRLIGKVRFVPPEEVRRKAVMNRHLEVAARDIDLYPAMADGNFVIYSAKVEIYDYDFAKVNRGHKLERRRASFGGMSYNEAGAIINAEQCIGCGACAEICSFDAIVASEGRYSVNPSRCDDCGSCRLTCPVGAIDLSKAF